jgi:hypothetical protein
LLNFKEKRQIKKFMRENLETSRRICRKVFEEKFQRKIEINDKMKANFNDKFKKNDTKLLTVFYLCNINYFIHKTFSIYSYSHQNYRNAL